MANSFKFNFIFAHQISEKILQIVECNSIALCLCSLASNPNTDIPVDIQIRPNINEY